MSNTIKAELDSKSTPAPLTLEQFEAWEAKYKVERPEMYAARVANGDIERQRVLCGGKPKVSPEELEAKKAEEKAAAKAAKDAGNK